MKKNIFLQELKTLLINKFPGIIDKVILFGSQIKGKTDSDYDILVVLKTNYDWKLENKIIDACFNIDLKYDILTDIKVVSNNELNLPSIQEPFIEQAIKYGIAV